MIERALQAAIPPAAAHPAALHAAMHHSLMGGGKRIRSLLVLASAEAAGGRAEDVLPAACAVELIHTYSLIHDDLPAMDDAAMRRNRPSCHVAFGEAVAILAGDALHALAFQLIAQTARTAGAEPTLRVVEEVAVAIGTQGMVGGQVLDLLAEGRPALAALGPWPADRREGVYAIHRWKTGALIRACARSGAILAGAPPPLLEALSAYGEHLGLAFQIVDDILDEVGEDALLGKDARRDAAAAKLTFPSVFGVERSRQIAAEQTEQAVVALAGMGGAAAVLVDLARSLVGREA